LLSKIRSKKHLQYISEKPCLICGGIDVQSAHIRFAGAGIGQKPCDIFTTPLCLLHHREQHSMNEKMFWQLYKINPIARAMGFALESPDKKIRERVYEHFQENNYKKFFDL
tara:strand:- start:100 stop:432 length:333 start_codon:yes stop_codon:yes gene_type:complete